MKIEVTEEEFKSLFRNLSLGWIVLTVLIGSKMFFDRYHAIEIAKIAVDSAIETRDNGKRIAHNKTKRYKTE